jgi:hypothetical protein|tara:strand:- start:528 stop:968 length:441 start_codon:yes stop_codon:yes gene_type:complete
MAFYNPLQGKNLNFPKRYKDKIEQYCSTKPGGGKSLGPSHSPFERQVDLWFLAFCLGVQRGKKTKSKASYRFIEGQVLARRSYMIELIELVSISDAREPYIIGDANKLAEIANEYAATGIDILFNALKYSKEEPLWNLAEYFKDNL